MEIYLLRTFVAVSQLGTIAAASEKLHLSQPAISGHIKAVEEAAGLALFERTGRGMCLTDEGKRLLPKAEGVLVAHRQMMAEAETLSGKKVRCLIIGISSETATGPLGKLLNSISDNMPNTDVRVNYFDNSQAVLDALKSKELDACFYIESGTPPNDLSTVEVSRFGIFLAAPLTVDTPKVSGLPDWTSLEDQTWILPPSMTCCSELVSTLFREHGFYPASTINTERESVTRGLISSGAGVGLVHVDMVGDDTIHQDVQLVYEVKRSTSVFFAFLPERERDPLYADLKSVLGGGQEESKLL